MHKVPAEPQQPAEAPAEPTLEQLQDVAQQTQQAIEGGADVGDALRDAARNAGLPISDEQLKEVTDQFAAALADPLGEKILDGFQQRGIFDAPLETVQPPAQPTAPPAPGERSAGAESAAQAPAPEIKRSPAARFLGWS